MRDYLQQVFESKLSIAVGAQNRWLMYLSYKEDCQLRNKEWNTNFDNKRVIMHNNTNVDLLKPTGADKQ